MTNTPRHLRWPLLTVTAVLSLGYGACVTDDDAATSERACVTVHEPVPLNEGTFGHKPKIQRAGNGMLVVVYGDSPEGAGMAYDVKGQKERPARDIFVRTCKVSDDKSCLELGHWSAPTNISQSATESSIQTAWQGGNPMDNRHDYGGDIDKPNVKIAGPSLVLTWVSKYCPDGDPTTPEIDEPVQRARQYLELDDRVVPYSCAWVASSVDNGVTWSAPHQLSSGERDAKQDVGRNTWDKTNKVVKATATWQEDPEGLQLGEADGPGDGASGANVTGGTDIFYAYAQQTVASAADHTWNWSSPVRLTDNFEGLYGLAGQNNPIYDGTGANVDPDTVEKGQAGASRANLGMTGGTAIVAWEETKGSEGLDEGKFIRYLTFPFNQPPEPGAGCIISNPAKNARRVRFLNQSAADAGEGGIQLALFWKEGIEDKGGPSDIVVRRAMGGMTPDTLVPSVDANCATSVYDEAIALNNAQAENISSNTAEATDMNLGDDTEANERENSLAHRGVLRGQDLWIGWTYTHDLEDLWAQLTNYNFWYRHYDVGAGSWGTPVNATAIEDTMVNVREPRFVGTPKSGDLCAEDERYCQDPDVIYIAWGTQINEVGPFDHGGDDLGIKIKASTDGGQTFGPVEDLSIAQGAYYEDDEYAFESQINLRPDGLEFYGVWAQGNIDTGDVTAQFVSGTAEVVIGEEGLTCE